MERESPFSEALRPGHKGQEAEGQKVIDLEFTTDAGMVLYRKKYDNGSVGKWEDSGASDQSPEQFAKVKKQLRAENNLE